MRRAGPCGAMFIVYEGCTGEYSLFMPTNELARLRAHRKSVYESGQLLSQSGKVVEVWPQGITADRGEALRNYARSVHAKKILEIGLGMGLSTTFLIEAGLMAMADANELLGETPIVTSFDPDQTRYMDDVALKHLQDADLMNYVRFMPESSQLGLPRLILARESFDFAFVDGDHHFDGAFVDVYFALKAVRDGGLVVLDDAWMPAVQKCVKFFVSNGVCEYVSAWPSEDKQRLIALRPLPKVDFERRAWDHFVDF
jgi:predicted O-methyltransferase YrrM